MRGGGVSGGVGGVTPPLFTELVGKTRSRSVIAEAVGKKFENLVINRPVACR